MADDAPTLLSINARDPDGLDTSWLYDVDFSPLRGRQVLITGDRAIRPGRPAGGQRRAVPARHARSTRRSGRCRPGGWRSSRTTPRSRTSERSWTVSTESLRIVWIYPDLLSTYGDRGNLLILARRAALRGMPVEALEVRSDQPLPATADIYLLGGGEDGPQALGRPAADRRRRPAPGGRRRARWSSPSAPATSCSAPRSSPRARSAPAWSCSTSAPTGARPGPSASWPATIDPRLGLPAADRVREPRRPHPPRPGASPRWPGSPPGSATTAPPRAPGAARSSAPTRTARRWPATRPWPTCCCAGPPAPTSCRRWTTPGRTGSAPSAAAAVAAARAHDPTPSGRLLRQPSPPRRFALLVPADRRVRADCCSLVPRAGSGAVAAGSPTGWATSPRWRRSSVGALLLVALVPRTFITLAAGALFGPLEGAAYALGAALVAAAIGFTVGRLLGREFVAERVRGRLARLDGWFARQSVFGVLTVRLLPLAGFGLVSYGYGTTGCPGAAVPGRQRRSRPRRPPSATRRSARRSAPPATSTGTPPPRPASA